jgi:hypothetical protein
MMPDFIGERIGDTAQEPPSYLVAFWLDIPRSPDILLVDEKTSPYCFAKPGRCG